MPSRRRETQLETGIKSECRHYWIIDSSQQNETRGRCRLCGEERVFQNKMSSANKRPAEAVEAVLDAVDVPPPGADDNLAV